MTQELARPGEFVAIWAETNSNKGDGWTPIYGKVIRTSPFYYFVLFEWAIRPRRIQHHRVDNCRQDDAAELWSKNANKQAAAKWPPLKA